MALWHPVRHRLLLYEAIAMLTTGSLGEILIWLSLSADHNILRASLSRFIIFDAGGLILLLLAHYLGRELSSYTSVGVRTK